MLGSAEQGIAVCLTSTLFMMSCCMVTDSTGYLPAALSAESMTDAEYE